MSFSLLVSELKDTLDEILTLSSELTESLSPDDIFVPDGESKSIVSKCLEDYWYDSGCDGRETSFYCAVVRCNDDTYSLVLDINKIKNEFHSIYQEIAAYSAKEVEESLYKICSSGSIRSRMSRMNLSRVHVKQVYRKLPLFDGGIARIQYSHSRNSKSIVKIDIKEAEKRLIALNPNTPPHIEIQLEKLRNHNSNIELVVARHHPPTAKANIFFDNERKPKTIKPKVPVFVRSDGDFNISFFPSKHNRNVTMRKDSTIEQEAFLPSIHVYRKIK